MASNLIPFIYSLAGVLRQMISVAIIIIIEKCSAVLPKILVVGIFPQLMTNFINHMIEALSGTLASFKHRNHGEIFFLSTIKNLWENLLFSDNLGQPLFITRQDDWNYNKFKKNDFYEVKLSRRLIIREALSWAWHLVTSFILRRKLNKSFPEWKILWWYKSNLSKKFHQLRYFKRQNACRQIHFNKFNFCLCKSFTPFQKKS